MISQVKGAAVHTAYQNSEAQTKTERKTDNVKVTQQGDTSRVDAIKASIEKGEYRVNLEALAQKIADELM